MFIVNPYIYSAASYIVDDYSAPVAYSVRKISSTATNCLRVRRDSDNAEQDIGFSGNDLDTASLSSFVGANSAYVTKWYNQGTGGSTYDTAQTTAASQPRIVNAGTIETDNGIVSVNFVSFDTLISVGTIEPDYTYSTIMVGSRTTANSIGVGFSIGTNQYRCYIDRSANKLISRLEKGGGYWDASMVSQVDSASQRLMETYSVPAGVTGYYNTTAGAIDTIGAGLPYTAATLMIGSGLGGYHVGYISEIIHFETDESANRTDIESDINTYYSIY